MNEVKNCGSCKGRGTIETLYYYSKKAGSYKTDLIAFCMCRQCFISFRFSKLPFFDDIFQLSLYIGSEHDTKLFNNLRTAKGNAISCFYCGNSKASFRERYTDNEDRIIESLKEKPCVVKLFTKDKVNKKGRKQVGYLCGYCRTVYFNNSEMSLPRNTTWYETRRKLPKAHPRFSEQDEVMRIQNYDRYLRSKEDLETKPHNQIEKRKLKNLLSRLEDQLSNLNHTILYSLGGYSTHKSAPI